MKISEKNEHSLPKNFLRISNFRSLEGIGALMAVEKRLTLVDLFSQNQEILRLEPNLP
jgi:hypothetical protein